MGQSLAYVPQTNIKNDVEMLTLKKIDRFLIYIDHFQSKPYNYA